MKRAIDITNYESFFLDYMEGTLAREDRVMVEQFLLENPGLRLELEGLENTCNIPGEVKFPLSENLEQIDLSTPVRDDNFKYFCIAKMENDLNPEQLSHLHDYFQKNPERLVESEFYERLVLHSSHADFENKDSLKKSVFLLSRKKIYTVIAIAASILIVLLLVSNPGERVSPPITSIGNAEVDRDLSYSNKANSTDSLETTNEKPALNSREEKPGIKAKNPVRAKTEIRFKVSIPIAKNEPLPTGNELSTAPSSEEILASVHIDPAELNRSTPLLAGKVERDYIREVPIKTTRSQFRLNELLASENLDDYAKQKFSSFLFGNSKKRDVNLWSMASAGIEKINDLTGSEMKLERSTDAEGKTSGIRFNSPSLSIAAPIK